MHIMYCCESIRLLRQAAYVQHAVTTLRFPFLAVCAVACHGRDSRPSVARPRTLCASPTLPGSSGQQVFRPSQIFGLRDKGELDLTRRGTGARCCKRAEQRRGPQYSRPVKHRHAQRHPSRGLWTWAHTRPAALTRLAAAAFDPIGLARVSTDIDDTNFILGNTRAEIPRLRLNFIG